MSNFRKTITVKRAGSGSYDQSEDVGFFKKNSLDSNFSIQASVQPATGSDTKLLPENRREDEAFKLFTSTELFPAEKGNSGNADVVVLNGSDYEVVKVLPWQNSVIPHYKVFVAKRTTNDSYPPFEAQAW